MEISDVAKKVYRPKKIAVCIPWGSPFMWMHTAFNLMNLNRPEGVEVRYINGMGRDPAGRHMWGVKRGIEWGATHICFLGADQLHPFNILEKFCYHMERGWPAVTALVPIRGRVVVKGIDAPFQKVAWKLKENVEKTISPNLPSTDDLEMIDPMDGKYQEVHILGSGAMLFDINLLYAMRKPWFVEAKADEDAHREAAMDTTFVWRLCTEAGGRMLADLTIDIKHLDVFPIDESYGVRFGDWTTEKRAKALSGDM